MSSKNEQVLVVTKDYVNIGPEAILNLRIDNEKVKFLPREEAEVSEEFVQIIPYVVILDENGNVLLTQRKENREKELLGKMTLGVGGHLNHEDYERVKNGMTRGRTILVKSVFVSGIARELWEELRIREEGITGEEGLIECWTLETIYKTESPVDKVHLGIICVMPMNRSDIQQDLPQLKTKRYESEELVIIDWISEFGLRMLKREEDNKLESWSQTTLDIILNTFQQVDDYKLAGTGIGEYILADTYVKAIRLPENINEAEREIRYLMDCYDHSPEIVEKIGYYLDHIDGKNEEDEWMVVTQRGNEWTVKIYTDKVFRMNYIPLT